MSPDKELIYNELKKAIEEEIEMSKNCQEALYAELCKMTGLKESLTSLQSRKKEILKEYVDDLDMESHEELIIVSQVIDYIEEDVLIQKGTF